MSPVFWAGLSQSTSFCTYRIPAPTNLHDDLLYTRNPTLSNLQFCRPLGWRLPHSLRKKKFLVRPIQDDHGVMMERVPRTGLLMYHQSTAPAPPPDLPPVVAPVSCVSTRACVISRASSYGVCCCASSCGSNAYSANGAFCTSHVPRSPGCSDVGGDHLEECVYLHEA